MEKISEECTTKILADAIAQNTEDLSIEFIVTNPVFVKETIGKYVNYKIIGKNSFSEIKTYRRYNEFKFLRKNLLAVWGGIYIPPLPKAKFFVIAYTGELASRIH